MLTVVENVLNPYKFLTFTLNEYVEPGVRDVAV